MTVPETGVKSNNERGADHPSDNLESAVEMLTRVYEAIRSGVADRENLAVALGYNGISGTSARKVATLSHFGFLERAGSGSYRISDLGRQLLHPKTPQERQRALVEAVTRPKLYGRLVEAFRDHALPGMLPNMLVREYRVSPPSSVQAVKTFRESLEFAGLLRNGILHSTLNQIVKDPGDDDRRDDVGVASAAARQETSTLSASVVASGVQRHTIALDAAGRVAFIELPVPATPRDFDRIEKWSAFMRDIALDSQEKAPTVSAN